MATGVKDRYNLYTVFLELVLIQFESLYIQWPAAAVIPAPIAYIKVAAVKKLVVGFLVWRTWPAPLGVSAGSRLPSF